MGKIINADPEEEAAILEYFSAMSPERTKETGSAFGIVGPLRYDAMGQMLFDADTNLVVDVRGWGHFQHLGPTGKVMQDTFGFALAEAFNEKYYKSKG